MYDPCVVLQTLSREHSALSPVQSGSSFAEAGRAAAAANAHAAVAVSGRSHSHRRCQAAGTTGAGVRLSGSFGGGGAQTEVPGGNAEQPARPADTLQHECTSSRDRRDDGAGRMQLLYHGVPHHQVKCAAWPAF